MQKEYYKIFLLVMLSSDLTQKSNAQLGRPHFGSNSPLYGAKLRSNARGMPWVGGVGGEMGGYGIDWYIAVLSTFKTTAKTV